MDMIVGCILGPPEHQEALSKQFADRLGKKEKGVWTEPFKQRNRSDNTKDSFEESSQGF